MRIGINALYWLPNLMGGTQTYFLNLSKSLSENYPDDEYVIYLNSSGAHLFPALAPNSTIRSSPLSGNSRIMRLAWENLVFPHSIGADKLSVLHSLGYLMPRGISIPSVITVLDMIHYIRPQDIGNQKLALWRRMFPDSLKRAHAIIAISNSVKSDICHFFPWAERKIYVTPLAVNHTVFHSSELIDNNLEPRLSQGPFVLGVASIAPHKNLDGLIRAFALVESKFPSLDLVLVGMKSQAYTDILNLAKTLGLESRVKFTGRIAEHDLVTLYQRAEMLVFPSHYEGFGLPLIESMACGCPVIASDRYSIPEVAGNAAILIDPACVEQIADAMILVLGSTEIRNEMINRGLRRASQFTWERTAQETHQIYQRILT